jgi:hypothetical protein
METVWLIGDFANGEAAALRQEVASILPDTQCHACGTLRQAVIDEAACPEGIVVVQQRPQEFSQRDVETLIARQPLANLVVAAGPWCASSLRSERLWPEAVVVPIAAAADRLRKMKDACEGSRRRLPLTASRTEAVLFDSLGGMGTGSSRPDDGVSPCVVVSSADAAFRETLADAARFCNAVVTESADAALGSVVLWDVTGDVDSPASVESLQRWCDAGCRVVAFVALPSSSSRRTLRELGVDCVLAKPFSLEALARAIAGGTDTRS